MTHALGQDDHLLLRSEAVFGAANKRFRIDLPFILAFGHELGRNFHALLAGESGDVAAIGDATAIFNLGISIFDYIIDTDPRLREPLLDLVNDATLADTGAHHLARDEWLHEQAIVESVELRILCKLIQSFFARVCALLEHHQRADVWQELIASILSAYAAEIGPGTSPTNAASDREGHARSKSVLPFVVMHQVARLGCAPAAEETEREVAALSARTGEVFWLIDDLADILQDVEYGHPNAVVAQAGGGMADGDNGAGYWVLEDVLVSGVIEAHAERLCTTLISLPECVRPLPERQGRMTELQLLVAGYVRHWLA